MKNKLIGLSSGAILMLSPLFAFAQGACTGLAGNGTVEGIICKIGDIFSIIIPILIVLGVLFFVWGVVQYVISSEEEAKKKGRDRMIFGIIGLVVIVAVWGLVWLVMETFGIGPGNAPPTPELNY